MTSNTIHNWEDVSSIFPIAISLSLISFYTPDIFMHALSCRVRDFSRHILISANKKIEEIFIVVFVSNVHYSSKHIYFRISFLKKYNKTLMYILHFQKTSTFALFAFSLSYALTQLPTFSALQKATAWDNLTARQQPKMGEHTASKNILAIESSSNRIPMKLL